MGMFKDLSSSIRGFYLVSCQIIAQKCLIVHVLSPTVTVTAAIADSADLRDGILRNTVLAIKF